MHNHNPPPRPCRRPAVALGLSLALIAALETRSAPVPPDVLSLDQAVDLVVRHNAVLRALEARVDATHGLADQAALLPNPEIEFEAEDIGINPDNRGLDESTFTLRVEQPLELGGKRRARRRTASLETERARWNLVIETQHLVTEARLAFIDLLAAQERSGTLGTLYGLGQEIRDIVRERVDAGKVSSLALTRAELELTQQRIQLRQAERELSSSRIALATLWNAAPESVHDLQAVGELGSTPSLPPFEDLRGRLVRTPLVQQWNTTTDLARAALARERAAAVPDVAFAVSLSHERATRAEVLGLALSAPLPLFDRNRGGIAAAASELEAARSEEAGIRAWLQAELEKNRQAFEAAREELDMIRDQLVPGARIAVRAAEESYRNGKVEYLVLLEAQRVLYDTEMQRIEAAADLDRTVAEIESLVATGTHR